MNTNVTNLHGATVAEGHQTTKQACLDHVAKSFDDFTERYGHPPEGLAFVLMSPSYARSHWVLPGQLGEAWGAYVSWASLSLQKAVTED